MSGATLNVIGYLRVSSDGQLEGYGLDAQEHAVRTWAKRNSHNLLRVVCDVGVSGATDALDRPGFSEVLRAIGAREAGGLVLARLDRLARALTIQEGTLAVLWRAGAEVFTAEGGQVLADDPDDPMRTALRQVVGVFSELERRMVVKRLRDGRAAKAMAGKKSVGVYAYGYGPSGVGRDRDAAPVDAEQEVITRILHLRREGLSYRQMAAALAADGHHPRRAAQWSPMTLRDLVLRHEPPHDVAKRS